MPHPVTTRASWHYILIVPMLLLGAVLSANIVSARASEQSTYITPPLTQTPAGCLSGWSAVESPNRDPVGNNKLYDVSVISANDIWAVGYSGQYATGVSTLTMHWDGLQWSNIPSPNPAIGGGILYGVSALSANNVWAVGQGTGGGFISEILIQHWDGTQWSIMPAPLPAGPATGMNTLNAIEALAPDDIWAVGDDGYLAIIMHWDGTEWQIVSHSAVGQLQGVSASAPNDVWAVGFKSNVSETVTMHWDGINWTVVPSPNPGQYVNELVAVEAISANDVWAVGAANPTLILHWNGTAWAEVTAPPAVLLDIKAVSPNDIWAVGFLPSTGDTITMHWDGTTWSIVPSPSPDPAVNQLWGLAQVSHNEMWAVGCQGGDCINSGRSLIERYIGSCLTPTASPSHTSQPPTSTPTTVIPTPTCGPAWRVVSSPNAGSETNLLFDVAAISANDVWAVGRYDYNGLPRTLAIHWDGAEWSIEPTPNPNSIWNELRSVAAISADDVWAVGTAGNSQALTMHWDGIEWSVVPNPSPSSSNLYSVAATSSNDVWAAGDYSNGVRQTLVMHWNGIQWDVVPSPSPGSGHNYVNDVAALSANDAWVVGEYGNGTGIQTLTMHWDGLEWSVVPSPRPDSILHGVTIVASNDAWAVGVGYSGTATLILHWNGIAWTEIPSFRQDAGASSAGGVLYGVAAVSANDVWATGNYYNAISNMTEALAVHWNGGQWSTIPTPNLDPTQSSFFSVAPISTNDVWGVGISTDGGFYQTLVERYGNPCATPAPTTTPTIVASNTPQPTASPSRTPTMVSSSPTATRTVILPSHTPTSLTTSTPTACAIEFTDVPVESAFYSFIRCLACRGIVSGYADGTFRPNNQVTRGQLAKIVSNSAGFSEPASTQTFEDVSPDNTFYEWIERLTTRGYMTGYLCGSVGEPCTTGRPYFRPFANATRGQTAKIVSNAAMFTEPPVGQTFEDVPPTHTFYEFIQRLASRNVMQGYECGGVGEPCMTGRPYFRPQNDVTRGQSAKIAANSFFPDCDTSAQR